MTANTYESYLVSEILPILEQHGRPQWDKPHTESVVSYVKSITQAHPELALDQDVLIIVAYLHDYGYIFFKDIIKPGPTSGIAKEQHAQHSAMHWKTIQDNAVFSFLSEAQKSRITHLITVHDELELLKEKDEIIFMEADTLGALSTQSNIDTHSNQYQEYLARVQKNRASCFITPYSQQEAARLTGNLKTPV